MPPPVAPPPPRLTRRAVLGAALLGGATALTGALAGCSPAAAPAPAPSPGFDASMGSDPGATVLLAYFSRAGENYYYGGRRDLDIGNTERLARMISARTACDVYRIQAADPYSDDYDATVARNVREQQADARPAIADLLPALEGYDTVILASPIWNVRAPMIMATFVERLDLAGRTVLPVTTYAVSGLGTVTRDYAALAPAATIGAGLAVRGEEVDGAAPQLEQWLDQTGLPRR